MPTFEVRTTQRTYPSIVQRGILRHAAEYIPAKAGKVFIVTTEDVWQHHGGALSHSLGRRSFELLYLPPGEVNKRLAQVEALAEQMVERGADRTSILIGFGGGI